MGAIRRIGGLLAGVLSIIILGMYGISHLYTLSDLTSPKSFFGLGALVSAFIIGLIMVKYLWSRV